MSIAGWKMSASAESLSVTVVAGLGHRARRGHRVRQRIGIVRRHDVRADVDPRLVRVEQLVVALPLRSARVGVAARVLDRDGERRRRPGW